METLIAFHGKPALKKMLLQEIRRHERADKIIQGTYGNERGFCAVGCSIHSLNIRLGKDYSTSSHQVYETELGISRILARLEDRIFEGLQPTVARKFPARFINAIQPGADLSLVFPKLMLWLLDDEKHGVKQWATEKGKAAIETVCQLFRKKIGGDSVEVTEWQQARADAAAYAAAAYAAYAAADAYTPARQTHFSLIADKLIELLKEAPLA